MLDYSRFWKEVLIVMAVVALLAVSIITDSLVALAVGAMLPLIMLATVLLAYHLTRRNIFFTIVQQGHEKQVMCLGKWARTLGPGFHFIGIWPFYKIYVYKFGWTGVKKDGVFEEHPDKVIDYILTKEDVYALKVRDAEDKNLVPLEWLITMTVKIVNSYKALFAIENWLETLFNRIGPYVRDFSTNYSYEEIIQGNMILEKEIFSRLEKEGILTKFEEEYGVHIRAMEVVDIDPDTHFRELTLEKRRGQANAARAIAETAERVFQAVAVMSGITVEVLKLRLEENSKLRGIPVAYGGYKEFFRDATDQVKRDRAGADGELRDVRISNGDGTPFANGSLAQVIGGIAAAFVAKDGGGGPGKSDKGKQGGGKRPEDMTSEELREWATKK